MSKIMQNTGLSRRGFLKASGALGAAAAFAGCGKDEGDTYYYGESGDGNMDLTIPADEQVFGACLANNCGGKCVVRVHIQKGTIKRITTDESANTDEIVNPQRRACLKCRGKRSEIYKPDRLAYPLMQTKERGDLSGFVRVTREYAFQEIARRMKESVAKAYDGTDSYYVGNSDYGKATIMAPFGGGSTHGLGANNFSRMLAHSIGGLMPSNPTAMSYPQVSHVDMFTTRSAPNDLITESNARADMFNCEQLVLWGFNPADSIMDTNTTYLLVQAKEWGIPVTAIDTHVSRTSRLLNAKHLAPVGGTDPALVCAILYHLIHKQLEDDRANGYHTAKYLDFNFIKAATHGFFDLSEPTAADFYNPSGAQSDPESYPVPAGTSFSAYILGNETDLVDMGYNDAPSIYPETIGYNVNSAEDAPDGVADPLYDKRVPIYGQVPKTPEWASYITGIPEQDIIDLAEMLGTTERVGIFTGWGSNRTIEGEQSVWAVNTLAMVLGFWGEHGKFWGSPHMPANPYSLGSPGLYTSSLYFSSAEATTAVNARRYNSNKTSFSVVQRNAHGQICMWPDLAANGGTGKSFWNDPIVKYTPNMRIFILDAFNPVNQTGDNKRSIEIIKDRSRLDLVVSIDVFMSPSAQHADFILPSTLPLEQDAFVSNMSSLMNIPKLIDPPGECLPDYTIVEGIIKYIDPDRASQVLGNQTDTDYQKTAFNNLKAQAASGTNTSITGYKAREVEATTFEEFQKTGYINVANRELEERINPTHKAYRDFLNGAATGYPATTSGKFEIYCQAMMEDYEARRWYNFDDDAGRYREAGYTATDLQLKDLSAEYPKVTGIYTKACTLDEGKDDDVPTTPGYDHLYNPAVLDRDDARCRAKMMSARFVYPIPMYIPLIEGMHACDNSSDHMYNGMDMSHPNPLGLRNSYPYVMGNHHSIRHAHSCADNNPLATEVYKSDGKGGSAFRGMVNGQEAGEAIGADRGIMPAGEIGVYEPLEISVEDAAALGLKTGDTLLVSSVRASALMSAYVTKAIRPGTTNMSEGAWTSFMDCRITFADGSTTTMSVDVAGSANTLSMQRLSRICQGSGYCAYSRISIQKVASVEPV